MWRAPVEWSPWSEKEPQTSIGVSILCTSAARSCHHSSLCFANSSGIAPTDLTKSSTVTPGEKEGFTSVSHQKAAKPDSTIPPGMKRSERTSLKPSHGQMHLSALGGVPPLARHVATWY